MRLEIPTRLYKSSMLWQLFCLAVAILVFSLILLNRSPNILRPISMSLRTGFGLVIPFTTALIYITFRIPGRISELFAVMGAMALFAFPLAGLWASGQTQSTVLSGLIPLYDAGTYYIDSLRLLAGQDFSIFSARRPLFPALMSVLLAFTGRNLILTLAILTAITGFASYLAVREIQHTHGPEAAVFVLIILFLFYRAHTGITMSENLGVTFGALGFGLLWRGAAGHKLIMIWLGLMITTLALNARAGAFFMLPILMIWVGWLFRERDHHFSWTAFALSLIAVITGFAINFLLVRLLATPAGVPFANFSYTLYGLASGGKSWAYIFQIHPELLSIQEPEQSRRIYQLAIELIREKPWQLVEGAFFNWSMLFSNTWYNVYSYVGGENWIINIWARWILYFLCILGLIKILLKPANPINSFVFVAVAGIFISVPFLPPTDAYRMRPYAASIIVLGVLPALGLTFLIDQWRKRVFDKHKDEAALSGLIVWYSLALTLIILIGSPLVKAIGVSPKLSSAPCTSNLDYIFVRFHPGTSINVIRQNSDVLDWLPNFHRGLFRENAHSLPDGNMINWAETIEQSQSLFYTMDFVSYQPALVVVDTDLLPAPGELIQICGKWETAPELKSFGIFYATEIKQISP